MSPNLSAIQGLKEKQSTNLLVQVSVDDGVTWTRQDENVSLSISTWPPGPTHVEPSIAPIHGGTELLILLQPLPKSFPSKHLTVCFRSKTHHVQRDSDDEDDEDEPPLVDSMEGEDKC